MACLKRVTCEIIRSGQSRPYADSITEGILTIEWQGMPGYKDKNAPFIPRPELNKDKVKAIARAMVHDFLDKDDPKANWASSYLSKMEMIAPGVWRIVVVTPFTD